MEPEEFDPFDVFKRQRPEDMKVDDKPRKKQHPNPTDTIE
jgi:hypothetical protein